MSQPEGASVANQAEGADILKLLAAQGGQAERDAAAFAKAEVANEDPIRAIKVESPKE